MILFGRHIVLGALAVSFAIPASADVWKASARGARQNAHYLINSETGAVVFMRGERCVHSYSGTVIKASGALPQRVQVESDLGGGGNGPRGSQRLTFTLQEGKSDIGVESSFRGNRPPLPAEYSKSCTGKTCALPSCG